MINWKPAQAKLGVIVDGIAGPKTYAALLASVASRAIDATIAAIAVEAVDALPLYEIDATPARLANFVAQTSNETGGFRVFEENLNYRASTMLSQWPTHFTADQARAAVGKPVEIASRAYGGRMGNAPYPSEDGYIYRGRGALALTGKAAYADADSRLHLGLAEDPGKAADPATSLLIAADFWKQHNVNAAIDRGDLTQARRITNGGVIGLPEVLRLHAKALAVLA